MERKPSGNRLRKIATAVLLGVSSLAIASCSRSAESATDNPPKKTDSIERSGVHYTYFEDGSRITKYRDQANYADILSFCDGRDLVDQTERFLRPGYSIERAAGNSIQRSVNHPACADGKLTSDDFSALG